MTAARPQVLVLDDDRASLQELVSQLVGHGHAIEVLSEADEALRFIRRHRPHVVVVGLDVGCMDALEFIERAKQLAGTRTAFVATRLRLRSSDMADAIRRGADHVLQWPDHAEALAAVVARALEKPELARQVERARAGVFDAGALAGLEPIVGAHPSMQQLLDKVQQAAQSRATVLIHGETGTGKELIAAAVHRYSKRADGPFVRLNCAALAASVLESELFGHEKGAFTGATARRRGRFEQADGGTLLLDEVSEMDPGVQVKLLRFLQDRAFERVGGNETLRVDVRIVAATNRDLQQRVQQGLFREDLYYRLNVVRLDVPPLRARRDDIPVLAEHFLRRYAQENDKDLRGFTRAALEALLAHPWRGNVRELQNAIEQAVVLCAGGQVDADDLPIAPVPDEARSLGPQIPGASLEELERYAILKTLEACDGSPTRAARILGISRRTIHYRLQSWERPE